jgi:hypothetical protein
MYLGLVRRPAEVFGEDWIRQSLPANLAPILGVTKYEAPEILTMGAVLKPLPTGVPKYDIEGAGNFPTVVSLLLDQPVFITEKAEGTNFSVSLLPRVAENENGGIALGEHALESTLSGLDGIDFPKGWAWFVNQRNYTIEPLEGKSEHFFWRVAREQGMLRSVVAIQKDRYPGKTITLRGKTQTFAQNNPSLPLMRVTSIIL